MTSANTRRADHPIDPIFLERWSPRAFDGSEMSEADLLTMFEAARWAPSAYNSQPWRFLYARRGTADWERFLDLFVPFNKSWAKDASALVIVASNSLMRPPGADREVPSHSHSLDAGVAAGFFQLQAVKMGWFVHGMIGFDIDRAFAELELPKGFRVEAAYAVGRKGDPARLPEGLRAREVPSTRNPLRDMVFEGTFKA